MWVWWGIFVLVCIVWMSILHNEDIIVLSDHHWKKSELLSLSKLCFSLFTLSLYFSLFLYLNSQQIPSLIPKFSSIFSPSLSTNLSKELIPSVWIWKLSRSLQVVSEQSLDPFLCSNPWLVRVRFISPMMIWLLSRPLIRKLLPYKTEPLGEWTPFNPLLMLWFSKSTINLKRWGILWKDVGS